MANLEGIIAFFKNIVEWRKKKKEEKDFLYMQASGTSILKNSNFKDHSYMQSPIKQLGLDKGVKLGTSQFSRGELNKK
jgi:hypothetical protein